MSPASPSGGPIASLIPRAATGCPRSWLTIRASTRGLMIAQYTQASIVSELKRLAVPASVDSIPSSAMQEDHVSMGWSAARKLRRSVDGLARVLAVELVTAARGVQLRAPLEPGPASGAVLAALRRAVSGPGPDRYLAPDIEAAYAMVRRGRSWRRPRRSLAAGLSGALCSCGTSSDHFTHALPPGRWRQTEKPRYAVLLSRSRGRRRRLGPRSADDPEHAPHERVDPAEERVGARLEVGRGAPAQLPGRRRAQAELPGVIVRRSRWPAGRRCRC